MPTPDGDATPDFAPQSKVEGQTARALDPLAIAALGVSILALVVTPLWQQAISRSESVRTERRAAYAAFIGHVERCGPNVTGLALQVGPIWNEIAAIESDVDDPETAERERARLLRELDAADLQLTAQCRDDLAETAGQIDLLAGSAEIREMAAALRDTTVYYRLAERELTIEFTGLVTEGDARSTPSASTTPTSAVALATVPSTSVARNSPTANCTGLLDIDRGDDPTYADWSRCMDDFFMDYGRFVDLARADTQAPVIDWTLVLLVIAMLLGVGSTILSFKVRTAARGATAHSD